MLVSDSEGSVTSRTPDSKKQADIGCACVWPGSFPKWTLVRASRPYLQQGSELVQAAGSIQNERQAQAPPLALRVQTHQIPKNASSSIDHLI